MEERQLICVVTIYLTKTRSRKPQDWRFRMSVILCAIRGGPECLPTIAQAITLAQETGLTVHFLYIANRDLLSSANSAQARAISGQIRKMGESVLRTALDLASTQGVTAQGVIRQGNVGDEIASLCRDLGADYLILGRPQAQEGKNVFSNALLAQFIEQIEQQTGAKVVPVDGVVSALPGMGEGRLVERRGLCHSLIKQGMLEHGH